MTTLRANWHNDHSKSMKTFVNCKDPWINSSDHDFLPLQYPSSVFMKWRNAANAVTIEKRNRLARPGRSDGPPWSGLGTHARWTVVRSSSGRGLVSTFVLGLRRAPPGTPADANRVRVYLLRVRTCKPAGGESTSAFPPNLNLDCATCARARVLFYAIACIRAC